MSEGRTIIEVDRNGKTHFYSGFYIMVFLMIVTIGFMINFSIHHKNLAGISYEKLEDDNYAVTLYDEQHEDTYKLYTNDELVAEFLSKAKNLWCDVDSDGISFDGFKLNNEYFRYSVVDD